MAGNSSAQSAAYLNFTEAADRQKIGKIGVGPFEIRGFLHC